MLPPSSTCKGFWASSLGMYNAEHRAQPEAFRNAFSGIWWSASTLLTVGYGDIYPITPLGKLLGIVITFLGVGIVAIPTGIMSAGFVEQYSKAQEMEKNRRDYKAETLYRVSVDYSSMGRIRNLLVEEGVTIDETLYKEDVELVFKVFDNKEEDIVKEITECTAGKAVITVEGRGMFFQTL